MEEGSGGAAVFTVGEGDEEGREEAEDSDDDGGDDNQFHNDPKKNTLTDAQIQSYSDYCESEYFLSAAVNSGGNSCFI